METKICNRCGQEKPIVEFPMRSKGGSRGKGCKNCQSIYYRKWYSEGGRQRATNYGDVICIWRRNHKDACRAVDVVRFAILRGDVARPLECSICGRVGRISGHHDDYGKPLEILWVCSSCHKKIHLESEGIPTK